MPGLIAICGPTATGKSARALNLAIALQVPLLSADSRQIYRYFDIGTAKPSLSDRQLWPHHLIDIADPTETYTVAQYQQAAATLIREAHTRSQTPILVGGTGLYIQAMTEGLAIPAVAPNPHLRSQLEAFPQSLCHQYLQQVDPIGARKIHGNDRVRTLRSLEVYYTTGQPLSSLQARIPPNYRSLIIGLRSDDRLLLEKRIARRTQMMLEEGWIEEVRSLQQQFGANLPLLKTLGYEEIGAYLSGTVPLKHTAQKIVQRTRQFAKRQMTWFRRTPNIRWLNCDLPDIDQQVLDLARAFLMELQQEGASQLEGSNHS